MSGLSPFAGGLYIEATRRIIDPQSMQNATAQTANRTTPAVIA